jgi:hypothetical protein
VSPNGGRIALAGDDWGEDIKKDNEKERQHARLRQARNRITPSPKQATVALRWERKLWSSLADFPPIDQNYKASRHSNLFL